MKWIFKLAAAPMLLVAANAFAAATQKSPPSAPTEVAAKAPAGTTLLAYGSSGDQPNADAIAVFESKPDKDNVRYRTLIIFGKKDGKFAPDFSSDRLIACSRCSQFHDDPFYPAHVRVTPGHVHIDQFDGGEKPSQTTLDFVRKTNGWHVDNATRETVVAGEGPVTKAKLSLPASGLAAELDAKWTVPVTLNTILINQKIGRFTFSHGAESIAAMWKSEESHCNPHDCIILVQQQDGCLSLVKDASGHFFGAGTPDPKDEKAAVSKAMDACKAAGGQACKEIRTDCSEGLH